MHYLKSIILLVLFIPLGIRGQSTSPNPEALKSTNLTKTKLLPNASDVITISEYPVGTTITDEYKNIGIVFGGSGPFITTDGSNPTSPVLSGTPRFSGNITGTFVKPGTNDPTVVQSFTLDAGYFDEIGSTRIEWFDPGGKKIGQKINSIFGIEQITCEGGNIASFAIGIVENEPNGFAIDNLSFVPTEASIIFREKNNDFKDGSWGQKDEIPGFDHTGFQYENVVYESHPGYPAGTYVSADGNESISISQVNGVQGQHSRETFKHSSTSASSTHVVEIEEIPVDNELAVAMAAKITTVIGSGFQFIDYSLDGLSVTLSPAAQKGGDGTFTCVGLVEWAAEQAGHNGGQGFIPNKLEFLTVPDPRNLPSGTIDIPLLSPQLLNYAMKGQQLLTNTNQWFKGFFDPVDFLITDPLGRRLGYVPELGFLNEIPGAFYSGDGGVELVLIPNSLPGPYKVEFVGNGNDVFAGIETSDYSSSVDKYMATGETEEKDILVEPKTGSRGDVNGDGNIDQADIEALTLLLNTFTDGLDHPGDLNGDGLLSEEDITLLTTLVEVFSTVSVNDENEDLLPAEFSLGQNYPNPFNPVTEIDFTLPRECRVNLAVYDILGREVAVLTNDLHKAGNHRLRLNALNLTSGVYIYRMRAVDTNGIVFEKSAKMILLK